jgi:hypothetical protein
MVVSSEHSVLILSWSEPVEIVFTSNSKSQVLLVSPEILDLEEEEPEHNDNMSVVTVESSSDPALGRRGIRLSQSELLSKEETHGLMGCWRFSGNVHFPNFPSNADSSFCGGVA